MAVLDLERKIRVKGKGLVPLLGHTKERIDQVGVELEGGWSTLPEGIELIRDSSVRGLAVDKEMEKLTRAYQNAASAAEADVLRRQINSYKPKSGELPSPPMEPYKVPIWMGKYYPDQVNHTCGLHVHMSFKSKLHYQRLITPDFQDTVVAYMTQWAKEQDLPKDHPIWPRLRGESEYCQLKYWPEKQLAKTRKEFEHFADGCRYTAINYCFNMNKGTMECRLLPMMETKEQGISAVQRVLAITNACLVNRIREEKMRVEVLADPKDVLYEEVELRV